MAKIVNISDKGEISPREGEFLKRSNLPGVKTHHRNAAILNLIIKSINVPSVLNDAFVKTKRGHFDYCKALGML